MIKTSFKTISWDITEPEYRKDSALSQSILAKYEKCEFNELNTLFNKVDTPSLTFGSAVDSIITGGKEEFDSRFVVADFPNISPSVAQIVNQLFTQYSSSYETIKDIPDEDIIKLTEYHSFYPNWKPTTRVKALREQGCEAYYKLLFLADNKTVLNATLYQQILDTVDALKNSPNTKWYFQEDNPFENIERLYQLKFKANLNGIEYRCMADLLIVDHDKKTVLPIDLKTSSKTEWDFYKSFIDWGYQIQARLYWRLIRYTMDNSEFKDYTLLPYQFIVINRNTLTPLVWEFPNTTDYGNITLGKQKQIVLRDPFEIGEELTYYLNNHPKVPKGIDIQNPNNINTWLNTL